MKASYSSEEKFVICSSRLRYRKQNIMALSFFS